jgi:hypothetical protein
MSGTIENGTRLMVEFGNYSGMAGIVQSDGTTQVAFRGRARDVSQGTDGTIDGRPFRVRAVAGSTHMALLQA